jgi:hypothetical protein
MTIISIKEYYAVVGSRLSDKDAAVIGPALSELADKGEVKPRDIVDVAKSSNSPLHSYFEWNDARAADLFRLEQARHMLRSVRVRYTENGTPKSGRAFLVTKDQAKNDGGRRYKEFTVLHGDRAVAVHMMRNALKELSHWRARYEQHQDEWERIGKAFVGVFAQIDEMQEQIATDSDIAEQTEASLTDLKKWADEHAEARELWSDTLSQLRFAHEAICECERLFEFVEKKHLRKCLTCSAEFVSDGPGNRLCSTCGAKSEVEVA